MLSVNFLPLLVFMHLSIGLFNSSSSSNMKSRIHQVKSDNRTGSYLVLIGSCLRLCLQPGVCVHVSDFYWRTAPYFIDIKSRVNPISTETPKSYLFIWHCPIHTTHTLHWIINNTVWIDITSHHNCRIIR